MQEDINKAIEVMRSGGTILYLSDTVWALGCDATDARAVNKIYKIKKRNIEIGMTILVDGPTMLGKYVEKVPDIAIELIESFKDPLTIVYEKARNLPKYLMRQNGTIAIRIPRNNFCLDLMQLLGKPITSTSANLSGDPTPLSFNQISQKIIDSVDYICKTNQRSVNAPKPSTIIKVHDDGQLQIIRS